MNTDTTTKRNKRNSKNSENDTQSSAAAPASITSVGDTSRDVTDTADVARASIAKGRGVQESKTAAATTAADIVKGRIDSDESIIQGTTTTTNTAEDDNNIPKEEEVISSGTSLSEDKSIDKSDIYSTQETGTRNLDKAQEKPVKKVEDKESGSWRIEEEEEEH
jgi:hypothetical protein